MPEKAAIQAFQVRATPWSRQIRLAGEIEAAIKCGFWLPVVCVNGEPLVAAVGQRQEDSREWSLYHVRLPGPQGEMPVRLDVLATLLLEKLVLWVDGTVVYADEDCGRVVTVGTVAPGSHTLPVPASRPEPHALDLPVPAADPEAKADGEKGVRR